MHVNDSIYNDDVTWKLDTQNKKSFNERKKKEKNCWIDVIQLHLFNFCTSYHISNISPLIIIFFPIFHTKSLM